MCQHWQEVELLAAAMGSERLPPFLAPVELLWMRAGACCTCLRSLATAFALSVSPLALCGPLLAAQVALLGL
jgi:hypothetical protein